METNTESQNILRQFVRWILSLPLRFKISIPYLVAAAILAGIVTYQVGREFVSTLEDRFRSQLGDATARTAEGLINFEAFNLNALRTIVFTKGVPEAITTRDTEALRSLVLPIAVNNQVDFIDVLDGQGNSLLTMHLAENTSEYLEGQTTDYITWNVVQSVLLGEVDEQGDKFADILDTPWGRALYTAGPVRAEGQLLGVVLVGTPLDKITSDLRNISIADVSVYTPAGEPVVSTLGLDASSQLTPDLQEQATANNRLIPVREVRVNERSYVESIKILQLRGIHSGWFFGNALPTSLITEARGPIATQLILIFVAGFFGLIALGVGVAQLISGPIFRLVNATREVGEGNLDTQVEVVADDEVGFLTKGFNKMVVDLQERDFINDLFGRMVSEEVREAVIGGQVALGGSVLNVTILFTDIQGYTSLTEKSTPTEIIAMLNDFFGIVTKTTKMHGGMVNTFGGDSALAVFGAPIQCPVEENIKNAISTAINIRRGVAILNAQRVNAGLKPIGFGFGINAGQVVAGNLGSEDRFEYTVIGDPVNVAARLESLSRKFPKTPTLIPGDVVDQINGRAPFEFLELGDYELKGKGAPVCAYAVLGSSKYLPPNFSPFDGNQYPKETAFIVYFLFCLGYEPETIGAALDVQLETIEQWLKTAAHHWKIIENKLVKEFLVSKRKTKRLLAYSIKKNRLK
jgi:class 3 adenylate cyclase